MDAVTILLVLAVALVLSVGINVVLAITVVRAWREADDNADTIQDLRSAAGGADGSESWRRDVL